MLGAVQGPAELLPVSSSAHLQPGPLAARLGAGDDADPEARKSFEVAVHAGGAAALLIGQRDADRRRAAPRSTSAGRPWSRSRSCPRSPPACCSSARSSERLGGPGATAAGLVGGLGRDGRRRPRARRSAAPATPGRSTGSRSASGRRRRWRPGVSRNGATLTAARLRRLHAARRRTSSPARSRCR